MDTKKLWKRYEEKMFVISAYELIMGTTYFDADTIAPENGAVYRNKRMAYLSGELFSMQTDPELIEIMESLNEREDLEFEKKQAVKW